MFDMFTPGDYIKMLSLACLYVYMHKGKTFEGENFCEFRCFKGIHYSRKFSLRNLKAWRPLVQQKRAICKSLSCVSRCVVCTRWTNRHL